MRNSRSVIFVWILLSGSLGFSKSQSLFCQQSARDVRLEILIDDAQVKLSVISPLGFSQLPLFEAPVKEADLNHLKYQAEALKPLGDQFWIQWKREDCQVSFENSPKQTFIECSQAEKSSNAQFQFRTLSLATLTDQSFSGTWKTLRFRLSVETQGQWGSDIFFVSIPVPERACRMSQKGL